MSRCKITVLKRMFHQDWVNEYMEEESAGQHGPCQLLQEGQEFIIESLWMPPEGFCSWAWADIRQYILTIALGGEFPASKPSDVVIACCTDGLRPVFFKLERVD